MVSVSLSTPLPRSMRTHLEASQQKSSPRDCGGTSTSTRPSMYCSHMMHVDVHVHVLKGIACPFLLLVFVHVNVDDCFVLEIT